MIKILNDLWKPLKKAQRYWLILLPVAIFLTYFAGVFFLTNPYGLYVVRKRILSFAFLPLAYLATSYLTGYFFVPRLNQAEKVEKDWIGLSIWSMAVACGFFFLFPNPLPLLTQNHTLTILATGSQNKVSQGAVIEIRQIRSMDGSPIPWEKFKLSGDWQVRENMLFSLQGGPDSVAEFSGPVPGGMVLSLRYQEDGGHVTILWDGVKKDLDLYTTPGIIKDYELSGFSPDQTTLGETGLILVSHFLYFGGLFSLVLILSLVIRFKVVGRRLGSVFLFFAFVSIFLFFLKEKFSYSEFNGIQPYFDSRSYVEVADLPLTAPEFWAGQRSFTLPLFYKLLDVHVADDWNHVVMGRISSVQIWLSITCWTALALVLALLTRQRWLKPVAFGIILLFGLNLEIGIWDRLMLSESLSFSFLALLIAIWLSCGAFAARKPVLFKKQWHRTVKFSFLAGVILVTALYSFLRDVHAYFLLMMTLMLGLGLVLKKISPDWQKYYLIYGIAIVVLVFLQNLSLMAGKRWEVPAYNVLAQWVLPDDRARDFFAQHGLPVSDKLMGITRMPVIEYTEMIQADLDLVPVKEWMEQKWRSTYLGYLLADLGNTLITPIRQLPILLDAGALRYHSPIYPAQPFSEDLLLITRLAYVRSPWIEGVAAILLISGCVVFWFRKTPDHSAWLVLSILMVSIYPLMGIVWFADPAEPQRHALQIGVQFRLAGWIGLVLGIDWITRKVFGYQQE